MKNHSVGESIFKPKWELKPRLQRYPTKRWGHTSVINNKKLYIYGGKTGKSKEPLYEIDCDTLECRTFELQSSPEGRESHSCSLVRDKLYIWGGCRQEKQWTFKPTFKISQALNDCISIEIMEGTCISSVVPQFPMLQERQSHASAVLKDKYIFIYGGSNEDDMYEDFWIFNTELQIWFEIKQIENKPSKRIGSTINCLGDHFYLFGGEGEDGQYHNQLFKISFSSTNFVSPENVPGISFSLVDAKGKPPQPRSSHASVIFQDRWIIIMGGEGLSNNKGKERSMLMNDIWSYDSIENEWAQIVPANQSIFKARSCFSANVYKNKIFILGGLVSLENFRYSEQFFVLSLAENIERKIQICNICKLQYTNPPQMSGEEKVQIRSNSTFDMPVKNIFKFSRLIRNPFDAFCLFLEGFSQLSTKSLNIDLVEGKIIMLQGESMDLSEINLQQLMCSFDIPEDIHYENPRLREANEGYVEEMRIKIFLYNIRNACARLGNTFLLVNVRNKMEDMMLVTLDNVFYCAYNLDAEDDPVSETDKKSYQIINNYIHTYNLNYTLVANDTFNIAITDLRTVLPSESQLKVNNNQIQLFGTDKTLTNYLSTYFLTNSPFSVTINSEPVPFKNSKALLDEYIYESEVKNDFVSMRLHESEKDNEILIYRGDRRVGKYCRNLEPRVEGYVIVPYCYELTIPRHRLQAMNAIERCLQSMIGQLNKNSRKRRAVVSIRELENGHRHSMV